MSPTPKRHKGMGEEEWLARLRAFASSRVWPSGAGNRPAPRQRKWYDLYQKIEKCPVQTSGQTTLFGGFAVCNCGFHATKDESGRGQPATAADSFYLPGEMSKTIPVQDQRWISRTLFHSGKLRPDLKLWYEPPAPALIYHQAPTPDHFFNHRLMVWMPYHLWRVRAFCPACGKQLTGYGVHNRARKILDIDRYYLMVTETLRCSVCSLNYLSSSQTIRDQLDLLHQKMFRLILTRKYACDIRVIRLLRDRTLGTSPARLIKQLKENHGEEWLNRLAHYLAECADFVDRPSLFPVVCQKPPQPVDIPTSRWLLSVYGRDILSRIDHIKASITCTFGSVLKMDSTKKITKKLAGHGRGTALWVTSIGNELGQILTSVLSVQEGPGLDKMVSGVMERYRQAAVPPPVLLYVDSGCCVSEGASKLQTRFEQWPNLNVRLDVWHFMRRMAVGCTTDAHPLYPAFMGCLSACIFEWDAGDVALLRQAKRQQLMQEGVPGITDHLVDMNISKNELRQYCRRRTRGVEATTNLIEQLLQKVGGANGRDLMGMPLLDQVRMEHIWRVQKRHIKCLQDLPGVQLYTEVGTTTTKGGIVLKRYRCARGSTSLETFHLHLNRFIPGTSANALNFQLYFLEGLNRWNQDRGTAAVTGKPSSLLTDARDVCHSININSQKVFGEALVPAFRPPAKYTGELLGVDYLLSQTGQPMNVVPDSEETDDMLEDANEGEEDEDVDACIEDVAGLLDDPTAPVSSRSTALSLDAASSLLSLAAASTPGAASRQPAASTQPAASRQPAASSQPAAFTLADLSSQSAADMPLLEEEPQLQPKPEPEAEPLLACSAPDTSSPDELEAGDDSGLPGIDRVDSLAEYLVELRNQPSLALTDKQVSNIDALWQNLRPHDKQQLVFAARDQSRLDTGTFRSPKKSQEFTPGTKSVKRHALTTTTAPLAQWPDCCRLIEMIFIRLCDIHRSPKKEGTGTVSRWDPILEDYRKIRILASGAVMRQTTMQLVDVSHTTLVQWHNKRVKKQDNTVLMQGLEFPSRLSSAADPPAPAKVLPPSEPLQPAPAHQYTLPSSAVGQAQVKREVTPAAPTPVLAKVRPQRQLLPAPPPTCQLLMQPQQLFSAPPSGPQLMVLGPVASRLSVRMAAPQAQVVPPPASVGRKLNRKVLHNTCKKCGQYRTAETGHSQYRGTVYCPARETLTKEEWLKGMKKK